MRSPSPSASLPNDGRRESPELGDLRQIVAELREQGRVEDAFEHSFSAVQAVLDHVRRLELKILQLQKAAVGKTSEKVDTRQLELLLEQMQSLVSQANEQVDPDQEAREDAQLEAEVGQAREQDKQQDDEGNKETRKKRGVDTSNVRVEEETSEVPESERTCAQTGQVATLIGHDRVERLEYQPGHFVLRVTHVAKYGFGGDGSGGVLSAPGPAKVIPRGLPGASLLADLVVSKHVDHLPLNRLRKRYLRAGVDIPPSTLVEWIAAACNELEPIAHRIFERIVQADVVRIDASGIKVLDPDAAENIVRGTMWCLVGDDRDVAFCYRPTGEGESGPWTLLQGREGYVQSDAANIFDRLYNGKAATAIEVGCNSHARRKFFQLKDVDSRVAYPLQLYRRLYKLEELARLKKLDVEQLGAFRQERSRPVTDKLYRWMARMANADPPDMPLSKAIAYALSHREALTRFLEDGRLDIDNNVNEQQIRYLALGRNNFLFAGSHRAAERLAVGYTITRTCAMHGVEPLRYVTDVLEKLAADWPQSRLDELLPDRWQALHCD